MAHDTTLKKTPKIVCITASTRNEQEVTEAVQEETVMGRIVVTADVFPSVAGTLTQGQEDRVAKLNLSKIELADELLVVNPRNYTNQATEFHILYANWSGTPVRYTHTKECETCGEQKLAGEIHQDNPGGTFCKACVSDLDARHSN